MFWSYQWWDLALQDLILHCNDELVAGVIPYFDGRHWILKNIGDIAEDLPKVIEELEKMKQDFDVMMEKVDEALERAEELAADNPEIVRFALVQMDWDNETTFENEFITSDSDVIQTRVSWSPNGIIETYVWDWYVTIKSNENETWIVRLRISKAKDSAFLNHL